LNFFQLSINASFDFSAFGSFAHYFFVDSPDFGEVFVNSRQIIRILLAHTAGDGCFRCHGYILAAETTKATGIFAPSLRRRGRIFSLKIPDRMLSGDDSVVCLPPHMILPSHAGILAESLVAKS